ncbi:hypothetical protein EPN18_07430 [bacterium]|nr:MAG: hypothetical protein EPN18_07430 [bacterium]
MNAFTEEDIMKRAVVSGGLNPFELLSVEIAEGLSSYWETAGQILGDSGIKLLNPPDGFFSLERNFFSALFIYSYYRAGIPRSRRVLYALVNQCLRGMVTGCDNILDDEYKKTLDTDLPENGVRFRSVIDIMVSDRVLFHALSKAHENGVLSADDVLRASAATLKALGRSGAEEASEEGGVTGILEPEDILKRIHHYKTGMLFQCPWAVPKVLERSDNVLAREVLGALYSVGMGCQIFDDMADMASNIDESRHNYVVSLIRHGADAAERGKLDAFMSKGLNLTNEEKKKLVLEFPSARALAVSKALAYLENGLANLFGDDHRFMVEPATAFLIRRIGVERFI